MDCIIALFALCPLSGFGWELIEYRADVLLKSHPVGPSLVPLLEGKTIRFEQLADLC
jgi:hypothetical protein